MNKTAQKVTSRALDAVGGVSVKEAARRLCVSVTTIRAALSNGVLEPVYGGLCADRIVGVASSSIEEMERLRRSRSPMERRAIREKLMRHCLTTRDIAPDEYSHGPAVKW